MHELSVALGMIEEIAASAQRGGYERVLAVHVRIGALSGIAPDALRFSWQLASAGTLAADSALRIEDEPLAVFCAQCGDERSPRPGGGLICPECAAACPTIVRGRDLTLVAVEVPQ